MKSKLNNFCKCNNLLILFILFHRGCESETDTEEYEKIGQMSIDKKPTHQNICVGTTQPDFCDNTTSMSVVLRTDSEMVTDVSCFFII